MDITSGLRDHLLIHLFAHQALNYFIIRTMPEDWMKFALICLFAKVLTLINIQLRLQQMTSPIKLGPNHTYNLLWYSHFSFCSLEFILFSLDFFIGLNLANTCINWRKFTLSLPESPKNAWTILSPNGLIASSGMRRKSSRLKVPQSPLSRLVNLEYNLSIWFGVTVTAITHYQL